MMLCIMPRHEAQTTFPCDAVHLLILPATCAVHSTFQVTEVGLCDDSLIISGTTAQTTCTVVSNTLGP